MDPTNGLRDGALRGPRVVMRRAAARVLLLVLVASSVAARAAVADDDAVRVVDLRTDAAIELLGTDARRPRLSWRLDASRRGVLQSAQQVLVATSPELLRAGRADVWDSGRIVPAALARPVAPGAVASGGAVRAPERLSAARAPQPWVDYAGPALRPHTRYYWTARVWDERGRASALAEPTWFETAFLDASAWRAAWIAGPPRARRDGVDALVDPAVLAAADEPCRPVGPPGPLSLATYPWRDAYLARWSTSCRAPRPAPLLRTEFELPDDVARARVHVSGLAYAEVHLNGARVGGDVVLDPGYTDYGRTVLYATHDVGALLHRGRNAIGVELGAGFFDYDVISEWSWDAASWRAEPRLRLELHVTLVDGRELVVASDQGWRTTEGPTRYDNPNIGETYDARAELPGWTEPGFDDQAWSPVRVVDVPAGGTFVAGTHEPIAIVARRAPAAFTEPRAGVRVYDVGEQVTGWVELEVAAAAGTVVEIRYAEGLLADGTVDLGRNLHIADRLQTDFLVVGAEGRTRWRPRFSYKGFRYVEVAGVGESALAGEVTALEVQVVRSAVRSTATFESDDPLLDGIYGMVQRTIANNLHGIVTDTPVYEKNGWTGDAQLTAPTAATLFDLQRFYTKWLRDMRDAQRPDGELPVIVPTGGAYGFTGVGWESTWGPTPAWDAALFVIPAQVYATYGDERALADTYPAMRRYVDDFMPRWSPDDLVESDLGDWLTPAAPLTRLVPSAYYAEFVRRMSLHADLLRRPAERDRYARLHQRIAAAFDGAFLDPETGVYREGPDDAFAQTAQVLPLAFGLVPPSRRARLVEAVVQDVAARGGNLATGIVGTRYLLKELTRAGRIDVAYEIATQTDRPSWGEWLQLGYTSLLEAWGPAVRSQDHHMFGSIGQWMIEDLAGIEPLAPGYGEIEFRPELPERLGRVAASLDTVRGRVSTAWRKRDDGALSLRVEVPAGAIGLVHVPAASPDEVAEEAGDAPVVPAGDAPGVRLVSSGSGRAVYRVGAGSYQFVVRPDGAGRGR